MKRIDIHTHTSCNDSSVLSMRNCEPQQIINYDKSEILSIGLHPWHISEHDVEYQLQVVRDFAKCDNVLAIGECGLDKSIATSFDLQRDVFIKHIEMAVDEHKPVIVHCVRAYNELLAILEDLKPSVPFIIHGFTGSKELVTRLSHMGLYVSFGVSVLKPHAKLIDTVKVVDKNYFFIETDDSGSSIRTIYEAIASIRSISIEELIAIQNENFYKIFPNLNCS